MKRPGFIAEEKQSSASCLVLDKKGVIGEALAKKLSQEAIVVYVGGKSENLKASSRLTHIPYGLRFPSIPEHCYSFIFIVDDKTKIGRKLLPKLVERAKFDGAQLILIVYRRDLDKNWLSKVINDNAGVKIVILGDLFEKEPYDFRADKSSGKIIRDALRCGRIKIEGDGLKAAYVLFLEDAILGILEAVFGLHGDSLFYLFPKHPPTQISLAHMIQKAEPFIKIDFEKAKKKDQKITLPPHGKYLLYDDYSLKPRIKEIFLKKTKDWDKNKIGESPKSYENNFNILPLAGFFSLVFLLLLPLILTLIFSFAGFRLLESAKENLHKGELAKAQRQFEFSQNLFLIANKTLTPLVVEAKVIGRQPKVDPLIKHISIGQNTSMSGVYLTRSLNKFVGVFGSKTKDAKGDFTSANYLFKESMVFLQRAGIGYGFGDFEPLIKLLGHTEILFSLFGFEEEKTYLILFQDNTQLRPTGGFISFYGLLTVKNGNVKNFSTHDVYETDRKLKGHVEPPFPLRRYAQQQHWYLKDSNFDIDFVKSASKSAFFLSLETGKKVDGVLGIDVSFAKNLISAIGPIYLADYKQLVDKNNLFKLTQMYIEKDLFPGLRQKRDFLSSLYGAILLDFSQKKNLQYLSLAKVVSDSMLQKHLLFAFADSSIQDFFTVNNWSSNLSLWDKRQDRQDTINDFIGINEANLGGNNANYNIQRKVSQNITLDNKGKVFGELSILYDNTSSRSLLNSDYKNYLRIILEDDAEVSMISVDNVKQSIVKAITDPKIYEAKNFVLPKGLEVDKTQEEGKTVYGFLVNIKSGKTQTITVKYSLDKKVSLNRHLVFYNLRFFKQPGTDEYPFDFSLSYPASINVVFGPSHMTKKENKVFFSRNINSDETISISLTEK